jgi:hypothetical protein
MSSGGPQATISPPPSPPSGPRSITQIEHEVDGILRDQLARTASREEGASEAQALITAAHRLDNLIHHRRTLLAAHAAKPLALAREAERENQM